MPGRSKRRSPAGTRDVAAVSPGAALGGGDDGDDDADGDGVEVERVEEVLRVGVDLEAVDGGVERGHLGDVVVLALALLFLELEGDAADGPLLDTLHQMGREARDLVAQTLGGHDGLGGWVFLVP